MDGLWLRCWPPDDLARPHPDEGRHGPFPAPDDDGGDLDADPEPGRIPGWVDESN